MQMYIEKIFSKRHRKQMRYELSVVKEEILLNEYTQSNKENGGNVILDNIRE